MARQRVRIQDGVEDDLAVVGKQSDLWPGYLVRGAKTPEDLGHLVDVALAPRDATAAPPELRQGHPQGPHVHLLVVAFAPVKELRRPVPTRGDRVGHVPRLSTSASRSLILHTLIPVPVAKVGPLEGGLAKVSQLAHSQVVHKTVSWLDVPVHDPFLVAPGQGGQKVTRDKPEHAFALQELGAGLAQPPEVPVAELQRQGENLGRVPVVPDAHHVVARAGLQGQRLSQGPVQRGGVARLLAPDLLLQEDSLHGAHRVVVLPIEAPKDLPEGTVSHHPDHSVSPALEGPVARSRLPPAPLAPPPVPPHLHVYIVYVVQDISFFILCLL